MRRSRPWRPGRIDPLIVSDEIYHGLVYEGKDHSILEFTDRAFVLNGFSKLFAMTGLRLGYVIAPQSLIRPMQKLQQNFFISANSMVQKAAIAALQCAGDDVARMKSVYDERRTLHDPPACRNRSRDHRGADRGLLRVRQRQGMSPSTPTGLRSIFSRRRTSG